MSAEDFSWKQAKDNQALKEARALLLKQNERLKLSQALYFAVSSYLDPFDKTKFDEFVAREAMRKACRAYEVKAS